MIAPMLSLPVLSLPMPGPLAPVPQLSLMPAIQAAPVVFALPVVSEPELVSISNVCAEEEEAELPDLLSETSPPLPAIITLLLSFVPLGAVETSHLPSFPRRRESMVTDISYPATPEFMDPRLRGGDGNLECTTESQLPLIMPTAATPQTSASAPLESVPKSLQSANAALDQFSVWAAETQELDLLCQDIAALSLPSRRVAFRMEGAQLGMLDVRLTSSDAGVSIGFRTETEQSRAAIAQAQPRLIEDLRATGLRVSDTHVSTDAGTSQRDRAAEPNPPPMVEHAPLTSDPTNLSPPKPSSGRFA